MVAASRPEPLGARSPPTTRAIRPSTTTTERCSSTRSPSKTWTSRMVKVAGGLEG